MMLSTRDSIISVAYIFAALLFVFGLRQLSSPRTARSGNRLAALGMLVALVATLASAGIVSYLDIAVGIAIGAAIGIYSARKVAMTAMPQMVALFNGAGGATAALVSVAEFLRLARNSDVPVGEGTSVVLGTVIGAISFSGSLIAFGKLQELLPSRPLSFPGLRLLNLVILAFLGYLGYLIVGHSNTASLWLLLAVAAVLGVTATAPIGGGDMPVVIAVLNSLTGLATALTGLVLSNEMLIVAGVLVGASGTLLTLLMAKAMNRSVGSVLFGSFGSAAAGPAAQSAGNLTVRATSHEDTAIALAYARRVVIIPGYGMAVAQAQHDLQAVATQLAARGVDVTYAVHPVAGRMPGHMNVLLAEANVDYDRMIELEQANAQFANTDVTLVVGANDVVNPAAREDPSSSIYGMPILDADKSHLVVVLKRGMSAGFAGIDNALFYRENTRMLFGDAKKSLAQVAEALKTA